MRPDGTFITGSVPDWPKAAVQSGWGPDYLVRALFNQDRIWVTAAGDFVFINQMAADHALNTLLFLERVVKDIPIPSEQLQSTPLYKALYERVRREFA